MTKADRWKKRPEVERYWKWCDALRGFASKARFVLPDHGAHITFYFAMPPSWSNKKKNEMRGRPHQSKPDWDNCAKAVCDGLLGEDKTIWNITVTKLWADEGSIQIEVNHERSLDC
jgi:Holliday junction resolvase RusA-like endonuclease